ncbi:TPA: hypothetical protein DEO28_02640 [Candidatus Dependentiae bacterium]|nr:MAG: hypothetical protein UR14_C0005G0115 [candidate division TM6 bacterium GW2011_GWE2_31_21]KKP53192.1 MAG: hypothetical protein UR43_C0007G0116 [candidate division TM6 bacterium GW2011_GWF2_33_332]HBS48010.1 hypothetical protein [Candidatus Dependentiae bacterium]HBZ73386.1 hypothetical protein [Candidatus Dependentiae bacterium]
MFKNKVLLVAFFSFLTVFNLHAEHKYVVKGNKVIVYNFLPENTFDFQEIVLIPIDSESDDWEAETEYVFAKIIRKEKATTYLVRFIRNSASDIVEELEIATCNIGKYKHTKQSMKLRRNHLPR